MATEIAATLTEHEYTVEPARELGALLSLRERSNYDCDITIDRVACQQALARANWLIPRLRSL